MLLHHGPGVVGAIVINYKHLPFQVVYLLLNAQAIEHLWQDIGAVVRTDSDRRVHHFHQRLLLQHARRHPRYTRADEGILFPI